MTPNKEVKEQMKEIALAIKAGSRDIFKSLYRAEYANLLYFVSSYTHNRQDAEDIIQDTMISLWENRETINPDFNFRSFVYIIARNKTINYLRDNAKHSKGKSILDNEYMLDSIALSSPSVEEELNALELQEFIDRIYLSLPQRVVDIFKMNRFEGLTYNEIADKMGITSKVVEYHISIALKAFRLRIGLSSGRKKFKGSLI